MPKENLICSNNAPEIHIFHSWRHPKLLLVPSKIVLFYLKLTARTSAIISKLVSQSKLLSSLFEFKENDSIVMSTIIKKICHEIEAC